MPSQRQRPARTWPASQARPVGLHACHPRPLRRSKDGQTIFPIPPAQGPKTTLSRRFPDRQEEFEPVPLSAHRMKESHQGSPGVCEHKIHRRTCRGTEPGGLAARARPVAPVRPDLLDMEVIVEGSSETKRHCASITCMITHCVARRAQVTEGHPHDAESSAFLGFLMGSPGELSVVVVR